MVIKPDSGTDRYTIARITDNLTGFVNVLGSTLGALAATDMFTIITPSIRNSFQATVRSGSSFDLPADGAMNTTLSLTPSSALTAWSIVG